MRFFTPISISKNQHRTPEGFLVCIGSAIARTGSQDYHESELAVDAGPDGVIRVDREEDEVFSADTIASAEGKDIVIDHPMEDVTPENWRTLSVGHMQNVRRGVGVEDHLLLADLVFKDPKAIQMILDNPNQELSCGYDAQYETLSQGHAKQRNIKINHVAMVDHGRCGPVCSTKDSASLDLWSKTDPKTSVTIPCNCRTAPLTKTVDNMTKSVMDRIRDAFKSKDESAFEAAAKDAEGVMGQTGNPESNESESHTHVHVHLETTKPEGGLPETGETRVTSAKDAQVGGEHEATFGGKTFFADKALDEAFKGEMGKMKDSIEEMGKAMKDGFEEMKKAMEEKKAGDSEPEKKEEKVEDSVEEKNKAIEGELKEEAPPGTNDVAKARDSAHFEDSFAKTLGLAEILVPGIAMPTFDKALAPHETYGAMCGLRRKALSAYGATSDGASVIARIAARTVDVATMPCKEIAPLFRAAAAVQAEKNEAAKIGTQDVSYFKKAQDAAPAPKTLADVQRANDAYWAAQARTEA